MAIMKLAALALAIAVMASPGFAQANKTRISVFIS
jgi:hypothetical protein